MELPVRGQLGPEWLNKTFHQRLDHFTFVPWSVNDTFPQRYFINRLHWNIAVPKPPIIVYTAGEWNVDGDLGGDDFPLLVASRTGALVVYIEHRYYGESHPFGGVIPAYKDSTTLGYMTIAQALHDFAEITSSVTREFCPRGKACPVISMGCSYGGMLAAWFRMKYPHIVAGALASSAPVLFSNGDTNSRSSYYDLVSNVFKDVDPYCHDTIKQSWKAFDNADRIGGFDYVNRTINLCPSSGVNDTSKLKTALEFLYIGMSQNDDPSNPKPERFCTGVRKANQYATVLERISSGLSHYHGSFTCNTITGTSNSRRLRLASIIPGDGWGWQTCTEIIFPFGSHGPDTMFQVSYFDYRNLMAYCQYTYNVSPRPDTIPTSFNISSHIRDSVSNIIFANGLRDPFSAEGVTKDISSTLVALTTKKGGHCTDLYPKNTDPAWLVNHRGRMINIIRGWITSYIPK